MTDEMSRFLQRSDVLLTTPVQLVVRKAFNPDGDTSRFNGVIAIINQISMLTVILTGAALIREREHGTLQHLLAVQMTVFEIAMSKVWSNSLVILVAATISLLVIVRLILTVPTAGSPPWAESASHSSPTACAASVDRSPSAAERDVGYPALYIACTAANVTTRRFPFFPRVVRRCDP